MEERSGSRLCVRRLVRGQVAALSLACLLLLLATAAALALTGDLTQPGGTAGCISETGAGPCANGHGLFVPFSVAVSPDGNSVYAASYNSKAVVRLDRNPTTGAITQPSGAAGCVSETGAGPCANGHGLFGAQAVAVSPDGTSVYVAASSSDAVARFDRDTTTGAITQPAGTAGCISETGAGPCADGHGLDGPLSVTVSPDGKSVYVASSTSDAVARLNRDTTTGAIGQPAGTAGCVSETGTGTCGDGHALVTPYSVAVSADGKSVYLTSNGSNAVARFVRNTTTGAITQPAGTAGCVSETAAGPCADGHALNAPHSVVASPDGKSVYVASYDSSAVTRLDRNTTSGAITQLAGTNGCVSETGAGPCANGHALVTPYSVAVSPDSRERLPGLERKQCGGTPDPQPDHRGAHPARRGRRLRQRDGGGPLCRRPRAQTARCRWWSTQVGRASTRRPETAAPWRALSARPEASPASRSCGSDSDARRGGRRGDFELSALHAHLEQGRVAAQLGPAAAGGGVEIVEEVVGVERVVVEEQQPPGADTVGERQRVVDRRSGPSRCARGTPRRCTGSRGSRDPRREPGRSPRSTPARGRRGSAPRAGSWSGM